MLLHAGPSACLRLDSGSAREAGDNASTVSSSPWTFHPEAKTPSHRFDKEGRSETCLRMWKADRQEGIVPDFAKWSFAPPGASDWRQFDGPALCKKLADSAARPGQARLLFVGDSLNRGMASSLLALLGNYTRLSLIEPVPGQLDPEDFLGETNGDRHLAGLACGGSVFLRQYGSLDLQSSYEGRAPLKNHTRWIQSFDIILLQLPWSTYEGHDEWDTLRRVQPAAKFWGETVLPHQRLIVRTSTIGHEGTGALYNSTWSDSALFSTLAQRQHREPFRNAKELIDFFQTTIGHTSWRNMHLKAETGLKAFAGIGAVPMDILYLSAMMWDRHKDPLHYCIPGPYDVWNQVLFNYLMRGHLDDYNKWAADLAEEVGRLGGLRNKDGAVFKSDGIDFARRLRGLSSDV